MVMNKLLVITGGTKGIGKAIIEIFAGSGFDIVTCARNYNDLNQLKDRLEEENQGINIGIFETDLSTKEGVNSFLSFIKAYDRPVDVLINNTGVFLPGNIHDEDDGKLETMIDTNLYSAYRMTRGLVGDMMGRKKGYIFNICSIASIIAYENGGSYSISKFAMYGMTKVLREEMKPYNIKVTAVLPGATLTASWEGVELPEDRLMKPEDVALSIWNAHQLSPNSVVEDIILRPQLGDL